MLARDRGRVEGSKLARKDNPVTRELDKAEELLNAGKLGTRRALLPRNP